MTRAAVLALLLRRCATRDRAAAAALETQAGLALFDGPVTLYDLFRANAAAMRASAKRYQAEAAAAARLA